MCHDQGDIALKLLDFEGGVNATLALPIIRTSVDYGGAFDIAGQGVTSTLSLVRALEFAAHLAQARKQPERRPIITSLSTWLVRAASTIEYRSRSAVIRDARPFSRTSRPLKVPPPRLPGAGFPIQPNGPSRINGVPGE
jgi:hypothetical protein